MTQLAICLVFLCLGIGRSLLIYFDYNLTGLESSLYIIHSDFWEIATLFQLAGVGSMIIVSEYSLWKGRDYYIFFMGFVITTGIGVISQDFVMKQLIYTIATSFGAFIFFSYVYLAIKLSGEPRKNLSRIIIGFLIYGTGLLMLSIFIVGTLTMGNPENVHYIYLISPVIMIIGLLLLAKGCENVYFGDIVREEEIIRYLRRLRYLLIIHKIAGITIHHRKLGTWEINPDLISGFLSAIQSFGGEIRSKIVPIQKMTYKEFEILLNQGKFVFVALIVDGKSSRWHEQKLAIFTKEFEHEFQENLKLWTGELTQFEHTDSMIDNIFELFHVTGIIEQSRN